YLDRLAEVVLARADAGANVTVLGFSQGVATASRWVVQGSVAPSRLILWGDFLPPDLEMERAAEATADVDVVLVRGDADPALSDELAEEETRRIQASGLRVRRVAYPGGHDIDPDALRGLAGEPGASDPGV
ncbi:MAG: hypothetical protein R3253_13355, partial [Longimicrobiales bacterium]|nr:hypothetical protein [Longimicrobiales bacterium]